LAGSGDARQPLPQVGQPTPWNTKRGWFFSCLTALKSGQPGMFLLFIWLVPYLGITFYVGVVAARFMLKPASQGAASGE